MRWTRGGPLLEPCPDAPWQASQYARNDLSPDLAAEESSAGTITLTTVVGRRVRNWIVKRATTATAVTNQTIADLKVVHSLMLPGAIIADFQEWLAKHKE
jgi:hypothetical protein